MLAARFFESMATLHSLFSLFHAFCETIQQPKPGVDLFNVASRETSSASLNAGRITRRCSGPKDAA